MYSMCLISRFFPARKAQAENLKINMAEADLSPTTFTSSAASGSDDDISLRIPLEMKTKIYTLKLPVIVLQMSTPINWIKLSSRITDQTTVLKITYKKWQPVCFRESEEAKGMNKN